MKRLLCLVGFHDMRTRHFEDEGGTYLECRRCGKVDDSYEPTGNGVIPGTGYPG